MSVPSEQTWLVLINLITDLNKKGYDVSNFNPELSLIRSSINFYKKDTTHPDMINELARAEQSLTRIQDSLLEIALEVGEEYFNKWLDLLKKATKGEKVFDLPRSEARFIPNTPPGMSVGRINLKNPLAEERVQEIAEYNGVIIEFDDDKTIAIYGDKKNVQSGLKEMGPFFLE